MRTIHAGALILAVGAQADARTVFWPEPDLDVRSYPFLTGGQRSDAAEPVFGFYDIAQFLGAFDARDSQIQIAFQTSEQCVPTGLALEDYDVASVTVTMTVASLVGAPQYDPTYDPAATYPLVCCPPAPNDDPGRPVSIFGAGFRNGYTGFEFGPAPEPGPPLYGETGEGFSPGGLGTNIRHVFAIDFDAAGAPRDVSNNLDEFNDGAGAFEANPFAIGTTTELGPGDPLTIGTTLEFDIDLSDPDVLRYVREGLQKGELGFVLATLHPASGGPGGGGGGDYPGFSLAPTGDAPATLRLQYTVPTPACAGDINCDGVTDVFDFADLASNFGAVASRRGGDVNGDGVVDVFDFADLASDFGCEG
jgi:hypothetical protein